MRNRAKAAASLVALLIVACITSTPMSARADATEDSLGVWNMYFFALRFADESRWGVQGDAQLRLWDFEGDLEQLLLRAGLTYSLAENVILTLGGANVTTGELGASDATVNESRIYQEALLSQTLGTRVHVRHRFRSEQRWNEDQDFLTRYRYALFINVPLNSEVVTRGTVYVALYNEVFINGERDIGEGRSVEFFDRNRLYGALGYGLTENTALQLGYMLQTTNALQKGQMQLSVHQTF
ncbi:MAG: DUF2490 domain-containing protein [Myxococcota bacterium]